MKIRRILSITTLLFASACQVISFFPLFTPDVVVAHNELQGVYAGEDDKALHVYSNAAIWKAVQDQQLTADSALQLGQQLTIPPYLSKLLIDLAESPNPEGDWAPEARQHYFPFLKHGYYLVEDQYPNEPYPSFTGEPTDYFNFIARFKIYRMVLVELDGVLYADTWPVENQQGFRLFGNDDYIAVHTFAKLEMRNNGISLHYLSEEFLDDLFEKNRIRLAHVRRADGGSAQTLLTASPKELQAFLIKFSGEKEAFDIEMKYQRNG